MPKAGASLCSMRSRRLPPSDKYAQPSSDNGIYFRLSSGCAATQGFASTDQFSFQRLKFTAGRAGQAGTSSAPAAAPAAVTSAPDNSSAAGKRAQRRAGCLFFDIVDLGDVTAGEFDDGRVAAGH